MLSTLLITLIILATPSYLSPASAAPSVATDIVVEHIEVFSNLEKGSALSQKAYDVVNNRCEKQSSLELLTETLAPYMGGVIVSPGHTFHGKTLMDFVNHYDPLSAQGEIEVQSIKTILTSEKKAGHPWNMPIATGIRYHGSTYSSTTHEHPLTMTGIITLKKGEIYITYYCCPTGELVINLLDGNTLKNTQLIICTAYFNNGIPHLVLADTRYFMPHSKTFAYQETAVMGGKMVTYLKYGTHLYPTPKKSLYDAICALREAQIAH